LKNKLGTYTFVSHDKVEASQYELLVALLITRMHTTL